MRLNTEVQRFQMSRSRKKNPYTSTTCSGSREGVMKEWKTRCNRQIRRTCVEEEFPNESYFKKMTFQWSAPNDGKHLWECDKGYRK